VEYANGATGVFITCTGDPYGTNRFEIQMDKAKLVVENNELKKRIATSKVKENVKEIVADTNNSFAGTK